MKKTIITRLSVALWLLAILMVVPLKASAIEESEVTLLKAIQSTGEQAFNTGYTHKANTRIELDCEVTKNSQREWEALFGARLKDFHSNAFCFFSRHHKNSSVTNGPCFNRSGSASGVETVGSNFVYDERIKLVAEGKTATWYKYSAPNTAVSSVTSTGTADDGKTPMFLFDLNTANAAGGKSMDNSKSIMTLYSCKIYEGSTLKCDFVPAKYNNVVGLYDRVSKTFSGSMTDKSFTAIEFPDASIQADYERAVNTIKDGQKYRIFTMVGTQKYYLTADGKLSTNVNNAPQFSFKKVTPSSTEREYEKSFYVKNGSYYFSNSSKEDGSALSEGHICTSTSGRDTWESQVFFLNTEGKYAIRSTNAKSGSSGWSKVGTAFWTVSSGSNGPVAQYSYNMNYVWQIEDESESSETIPGTELLTNGKCDGTYTGWTKKDGGSGWGIGNDNGVKYWVSSNGLCTLSQTVSLSDFSIDATRIDNNFVTFIASAKMKTPSKNNNSGKGASANSIIVYMLDANGSSIGMETVFNDLSYYENWTTIKSNPITLVPGTRKLMYRVTGQDAAYLSGQHGPAYRDLSLKVSVDTDSPIPDPDPITVTSGTVDWTNGTYNVTSDVTIERRIQVYGNVTLNLGEGCTLTAMKGIGIFYDSNTPAGTLTINGPGTLIAGATDNNAGIGGNGSMTEYGCITINGGTITARGGMYAAGIGGGKSNINRHQSSITINGGVVTAIGGDGGAGIGGGYREPTGNDYGLSGDIIINGGQVTATGGMFITRVQAPGIGRGYRATGNCGTLTLGWTNATDFIAVNGGYDEFNIRFVEGKEFVFEGTTTVVTSSNLHSYIKKLVPNIPKPEGLAIDATNFPDEVFRNYLLGQSYGEDGVITSEEIQNITDIDFASGKVIEIDPGDIIIAGGSRSLHQSKQERVTVSNYQPIQSLQGIEFFTALKHLNCIKNQLTTLDLSSNTALETLICEYNQLTTLKLPESTTLKTVSCYKNQLATLDVSKNTALETLYCDDNQLTTLDLSHNTNLLNFSCYSNQIKDEGMDALVTSLPTKQDADDARFYVVDATDENEGNVMTTTQVEAAKQKGWEIFYWRSDDDDEWQEYAGSDATPEGIAIDATNFPDETFRNYLLSQDYGLDGVITPQEIKDITVINVQVSIKVIKTDDDEDDVMSRSLQESRYQSKQKRMLASDQQPIQSLQGIEFFTALEYLTCDGNQLTTLDLSKNTALESLSCANNRLTTLKLPESTTLKTLYCEDNQLTTLDLSKNTVLEYLSCYNNQLTTLDLSKNTALKYLYCEDNQLSTLDLSKNTQLCGISFCSNQIKDAGMDALVASLPTKQNNEKAELYVFDATNYQGKEGNVMTTTQVEAAKQKGWKVYYWRSDDDEDWTEYAGSTPIVTYPVWVGETQVTENNMKDVLGDGKVTYTPGNNTGTLKFKSNTTINGSHAAAKIYVDGIDLVINAPKGIVLENSTLGISMGGENRKLTVNGDITIKVFSPAINNCQELTINGNLTVESRTPIYCKSITVNGNVKVTGSTTGLNAPTIVLNGTKHEFNTSNPCISADGAVTITGDLTATANDRPVISAKGGSVVTLVSGTWTLDGGNYPAIELMGDAQLVIPSTHAIVEPENAQMKAFTGRNPYTTIADADGNAATHVVIAPHHVHSMKETTGKGATCTEPGFETYWTCTSCNKMFSDEQGENEISAPREIPATGHIWGEWVVTREATTTQEGEETHTCLNDPSHKETHPIPVLESGIAIDETNFPDANFRQFVLDNYDKKSNKLLSDEEIAAVTHMDIDEKEIADLTGIEYFTALKNLNCYNNKLKALDLSKNTALQSLACQNNQLKALDLSKNTELHLLGCGDNQLTELDLSKNTKLITLDCYLNQINGKAMDALIESLPQVTDGEFYAISTVNDKEQNVITKSQVAAAKAKGWTVYDRTEKPGFTYEEYEGSSDPVPDGIRNAMNGNGDDDKLYNLQGRRVERVAKKGVFIKNGKKVIRK